MTRGIVALVTIGVVTSACSGLLEMRAEVPDGTPPEHLVVWFERYRDGLFLYDDQRCWFVHPGAAPPGAEFACGDISIGLRPEYELRDIASLLGTVEAVIARDLSDDVFSGATVSVPERSEGDALLQLLLDDRLSHASLSFVEVALPAS